MFQYYKNLLLSNVALYNTGPESGGSPEERQERSDLQVKIEAAKKELVKLGKTPEVAELERAVKEIAGQSRTEAGKLLLDTIVTNHFSQNPNNTSGEFQSHMYAIDFDGEDSIWDKRGLQAEDVIALEKYGITQEQVIAALNAKIPTQRSNNAYAEYRNSREEGQTMLADKNRNNAYTEYANSRVASDREVYMASLKSMGDGEAMESVAALGKVKGQYQEYAESRKEGVKIAAMEKNYASMPADARSQDIARTTATTKLADLLKGGDIKFSELKKNPDAIKALQVALKSLGFDIGKTGTKKDGIDGIYEKNMERAVIAFQKSLDGKIKVDGDVGTATLTALLEKTQSLPTDTGTMMADTPELKNPDIKTA